MKKLKNLFFGVLGGIIFIIGGIILLFWNERDVVKNNKTVSELKEVVVEVDSGNILSSNDGKLVNTSGKINILSGSLTDSIFGVTVDSTNLERIVEIYQWVETEDEDSDGDVTYSYKKEWKDTLIDSSDFNNSSEHVNPTTVLYSSQSFFADSVKVGEYILSKTQIRALLPNTYYTDFIVPAGFYKYDKYLSTSSNYENPQIGDIRISFKYNSSTDATILAKQNGLYLETYYSKAGKGIDVVSDGIKSSTEMIQIVETNNNIIKWLLRGAGIFLEIVGFMSLLGPLQTLVSFIPILGKIASSAINRIGLLMGLFVSCLMIGIAWLVYRPLIGLLFLGVCAGIVFLIIFISNKNKIAKNDQPLTNNNVIMTNVSSNVDGNIGVINPSVNVEKNSNVILPDEKVNIEANSSKCCQTCGTKNSSNSNYCITCGKQL